ncbi:2-methylaconitate cis-trans isomerase PrpF family protein [Noviherbaspirillum galbum]|uniref:3-methylitaconate isomerase n=1 Tax=Noviherbaspirillum galbum TaxID=2709383 RepID=A0A6B3SYQ7_9BURK|nr:PrpF domain-containing protein [Noviherbaspirillum galbum]NEX64686.1 3-methylitaconate isomerase [Noviherbaspirillum galbum]
MKEQIRVPVVLMRGGTSKAVFLAQKDVPADLQVRHRFLLALFGSPDIRQIDGLGGADILTSKCAIIGPPTHPDADIDYTFTQIGIDQPTVSYEIVCGNISSATAVYALQEKLVPVQEPITTVRVHNTNTGKILRMKVQCADGEPLVEGDCEVDGVPGTGAEVALDYSGTSGGATGRLLPTGQAQDKVHVPRLGREVSVSIVDVGTVCVFIRAADLGVTGTELPGRLDPDIHDIAEEIRRWAAERCKLDAALTPFQILIGPPQDYQNNAGDRVVKASEVDLVARMVIKDGVMHKAFPGGGSVCLSVAAQIPGTIPAEARGRHASPARIRIGHPSGVLGIYAHVEQAAEGEWTVREVHFTRTARRLFDGTAYIRRRLLEEN